MLGATTGGLAQRCQNAAAPVESAAFVGAAGSLVSRCGGLPAHPARAEVSPPARTAPVVGEAAGPVDSGVVLVYGSHTFGEVDAPDVGRLARDFRKSCEGKGADASV